MNVCKLSRLSEQTYLNDIRITDLIILILITMQKPADVTPLLLAELF